MKILTAFVLIISGFGFAFGQNERSPIVEKEFGYKDWTLNNLNGDGETNLRKFSNGKKLVMVVYWAPWCPNWRHDAAFVEELHARYSKDGLAVIGVGEYDTVEKMRRHYEQNKFSFPSVYESSNASERLTTVHHAQRTAAGDIRKWGSPWYVFLDPSKLLADSDELASRVSVINGEMTRPEVEKFIREKLGLAGGSGTASAKVNGNQACEPAALIKP
ncbi:MAG: TlpA family protein disulfide reductase [Pyrinomonadaceae bacterium]